MVHRIMFVAAALLPLASCGEGPPPRGTLLAGPEVQAAVATCEAQYAAHALTTFAEIAACERDLALPQEERERPDLAKLYASLWSDKVELYTEVDQGRLSKADADRKLAIRADNWLSTIQSVRRL